MKIRAEMKRLKDDHEKMKMPLSKTTERMKTERRRKYTKAVNLTRIFSNLIPIYM
jgi:hypothetical protein